MVEKLPSQLPAALQKHGVKLLSDNVLGPTHKAVLLLEATQYRNLETIHSGGWISTMEHWHKLSFFDDQSS